MLVPTATVREGDVVRVLPGERVPVDGVVLAGTASGERDGIAGWSCFGASASGHGGGTAPALHSLPRCIAVPVPSPCALPVLTHSPHPRLLALPLQWTRVC